MTSSVSLPGMHAVPTRLKALFDRLLITLDHDQFVRLLNSCGWTYEDYRRGYMLTHQVSTPLSVQDSIGSVMDHWSLVGHSDERLILNQFLRFAETRSIAFQLLLQQALQHAAALHGLTGNDVVAPPAYTSSLHPSRTIQTDHNTTRPSTHSSSPSVHHRVQQSMLSASSSTVDSLRPEVVHAIDRKDTSGSRDAKSVMSFNEKYSVRDAIGRRSTGRDYIDRPRHSHIAMTSDFRRMTSTSSASCISGPTMRRPWQTTPGYGGTLVSATGKKRVLCSACRKTFCDKGALKIHYSAVHLKEMHRCTVDGCSMMFSSRRSRNRHSANPNSKLHIDHRRSSVALRMTTSHLAAYRGGPNRRHVMSAGASDDPPFVSGGTTIATSGGDYLASHEFFPKSQTEHGSSLPWITHEMSRLRALRDVTSLNAPATSVDSLQQQVPVRDNTNGSVTSSADVMQRDPVNASHYVSRRKSVFPTRHCAIDEYGSDEDVETTHGKDDVDLGESFSIGDEDVELADDDRKVNEDQHENVNDEQSLCSSKREENKEVVREGERKEEEPPARQSTSVSTTEVTGQSMSAMTLVDDQLLPGYDDRGQKSADASSCGSDDVYVDCDSSVSSDSDMSMCNSDVDDRAPVIEEHLCHVPGCNAVFPTRRSRDRHSSNVPLHRKLLSTSNCSTQERAVYQRTGIEPSSRTSQPEATESGMPVTADGSSSVAALYYYLNYSRMRFGQQVLLNATQRMKEAGNGLLSATRCRNVVMETADGTPFGMDCSGITDTDTSSGTSTTSAAELIAVSSRDNDKTPVPRPSPDGTAVCHVCQQAFLDNLVLKEHLEKVHPREMYRCTVPGCDKIFSTRKSRNRHSQNDNLHYIHPFGLIHD